ncbi:hypothetical protein C6P40_003705 [Pichia californica]|uniref:Major facilitator superfamily (MFS) profile domain-containing protein n=1 Tax=Pichia californica TaxID=460514 RepID=A0A9P6WNF8_9ASCO|nr:hypothetical protein C6P42_004541 [[Candida] californica]KAG0690161.1 hypothetical protein C6P40_003705 [[Candida] californica]
MTERTASTPLLETETEIGFERKMKSPWTRPLIINVLICCLASIQYGFHMSELNAPAKYIRLSLGLSQSQLGLVTSIFSIGGLISSTFASYFSTIYGLRISFIITSIAYIFGSLIESKSKTYTDLLIGRFISGIGGGLAIVYVPIYVNDISPINLRGILGSMTQISVNFGILLAQILAIKWNGLIEWRNIINFGWIIGLINILLVIIFLFESPKWLIIRSKNINEELGFKNLSKLRGLNNLNLLNNEIDIWKIEKQAHSILIESNPHLKNLGFWNYLIDKNYFNSRMISTFMMIGQQFSGINCVIFYGVDILNKVFPHYAVLTNVIISIGNMTITSISSLFLDKLGRRPLLMTSLSLMIISLIFLGIGILNENSIITITSIFTYVGSFAIGCGPIPFLIISEVSQIEIKDIAQSWATDCNWTSVFIIGTMFPIINSLIGGWIYLIFATCTLLFLIFVKIFVPETKGCATYEEVWGGSERVD